MTNSIVERKCSGGSDPGGTSTTSGTTIPISHFHHHNSLLDPRIVVGGGTGEHGVERRNTYLCSDFKNIFVLLEVHIVNQLVELDVDIVSHQRI